MRKLVGMLVCFALLTFSAGAVPQYETDVSVDITAKTVTEAKKQALAKATRDALAQIVRSISTEKSVQELNELNDNQLQHFIAGIMVLMEKSSDVRYIADLRISVNEEVLKAYMAENDMPFVAAEEQKVLVVPLLENENGSLDVWSDTNVWRQAFLDKGKIRRGNLTVLVIRKNLGNISAVQTNRYYNMSDGEYNELAGFNQVNKIYVLKYVPKDGKVYLKSFPKREIEELRVNDEPLSEVVDMTLPLLKGDAKTETIEPTQENVKTAYDVIYTYPQLVKWSALKRLLEDNPSVSGFEIVSMGSGKVRFRFEFNGAVERLQADLGEAGYQLRNEGGYYAIY